MHSCRLFNFKCIAAYSGNAHNSWGCSGEGCKPIQDLLGLENHDFVSVIVLNLYKKNDL